MNLEEAKAKVMEDLAFLMFLKEQGYLHVQPIVGGRYAAIQPMIFTHAIIVGQMGDETGYDDRWCYHTLKAAEVALDAWNGIGEPEGWHRHPATGRRREVP